MQDIYHTLGRIEMQTQNLQTTMEHFISNISELNQRISCVERQQSYWKGCMGIFIIILTILGGFTDKCLNHLKGV